MPTEENNKNIKMKNISIFLLLFIFFGCNTYKNERIIFVSLKPRVITTKSNKVEIFVDKYIESSPYIDNYLRIAKSEGNYQLGDTSTPRFGLDKFYLYKYDAELETSLKKLFSTYYENSYYRKMREGKADDRNLNFIIIENGKKTRTILYEHHKLPEDLKEIDSIITEIFNSDKIIPCKRNISEKVISSLQESLYKRNPPPRLIKSSVKFDAPVIENTSN
jgi:hypothetical protein